MEQQPGFEKQPSKPISQNILSPRELSRLPKEEREKITTATGKEILDVLHKNAIEYQNVSEMYEVLRGQPMIARRESPEHLLKAITEHESLHVGFPEGERYSNAVIWNPAQGPRGLDNAYLEGYSEANGVVAVLGFKQSALYDVVSLEDASQKFAGLDRMYVRSVQGDVKPEDILFVSVRIPLTAFPQEKMTPEEIDRLEEYKEKKEQGSKVAPQFIHRGFLFSQNLEKQ